VVLGILLVLLGVAVGLPIGWIGSVFFPVEGEQYILTRELDTAATYPFQGEPPLRASLKPGSEVRVVFKKGEVLYLRLHTAVTENDLLRATGTSGG
jgi:hypothetical protein